MVGPLQRPAPGAGTQRIHKVVGAPSRAEKWIETTPPRSWAELAETLHGGLAVLDDWCLTYVSERFLRDVWHPDDILGLDFRSLSPALAEEDSRDLRTHVEHGVRIEFEQQFLAADGPRSFRITVLPLSEPGDRLCAVVFAKDVTATSRALAQLRDTTLALTEIEDSLRQRLSREIHDGPIQLLAALVIRLGLAEDNDVTRQLQATVSSVAAEMRSAVGSFSSTSGQVPAGLLLRQWITPCLAGSEIDVEIHDQRSSGSELSETQAAFVFLYQTVRAARHVGRRRRIQLTLLDENDGIRLRITINSSSKEALEVGRVAAQYRAVVDHARALGGTLTNSIDGSGTRLLSMWIPAAAPLATGIQPTLPGRVPPLRGTVTAAQRNATSGLPRLDDATWLTIARAAPERLVEHDEHGRFSFVNDVQQDMLGRTSNDLLGESMFSVFSEAAMNELRPVFERLLVGEVIDVQWLRDNAFGELRSVRVRSSPRLDRSGRLLGTLSAVDDLSDVHFLDELYQSALSDLARSRRLVTGRALHRLRPCIDACTDLVAQLTAFAESEPDASAFRSITTELEIAMGDVRRSVDSLDSPDVSIDDLGHAVRTAVASVNQGTELQFLDRASARPSPESNAALFQIAREAVLNAIVHGSASTVVMELSGDDGGFALDIRDDGVGIKPGDLDRRPGHIGTRSMQERAREMGGECRIEPDRRGGTMVRVRLPAGDQRSSPRDSSLLPT